MRRRDAAAARGWRKLAASIWTAPRNPQIFGELEIDAGALLGYIERTRAETGARITVTHAVGKACAHAFAENPDLNTYLSRGRFVRRESVDIFFVVEAGSGRGLSGVKVEHVDRKSLAEIATELAARADRIRSGDDPEFGQTMSTVDRLPGVLLRAGLGIADRLTMDWNVDLRRLGAPGQAFGSAMVSSVATFGVQRAFTPLSPYYRVPFVALISEIVDKPAVVDGQVVPRPLLAISATLDHRYLDGYDAGRLSRAVRAYLENPGGHE